jgi:hypothetical protein
MGGLTHATAWGAVQSSANYRFDSGSADVYVAAIIATALKAIRRRRFLVVTAAACDRVAQRRRAFAASESLPVHVRQKIIAVTMA